MIRGRATDGRGRKEPGQAILEMAVVLPFLALILAAAFAFGPLAYIHIATQQATYDCALAAAQSLNAAQGHFQGDFTARQSLAAFNLDPGRAAIRVAGDWRRGGIVRCETVYQVPTGAFPFHGLVSLPSSIDYTVSLPPQALKSEWR
jgi:hypothetical protein